MTRKQSVLLLITIIVSGGVAILYLLQNRASDSTSETALDCKDCNLIMISLSDVSAKNMSLYGYERITTPNLDKWAQDAFVFNNAFTQTSWTLPVATSLFTSLYPYSHKVMGRFGENILDENIQTLPEILRDQGYKTAAFTGGLDYDNNFGHMRGFDKFEATNRTGEDLIPGIYFSGLGVALAKGLRWIEGVSDSKFFLFVHGYDVHCPFDPPEKFKGVFSSKSGKNVQIDNAHCIRGYEESEDGNNKAYYYKSGEGEEINLSRDDISYLEELYDEEILSVDDSLETFLVNIDDQILDKTIIIVFSDHGEMFARNGRFGRGGNIRGTLYEEVLNIPLIIKTPQQIGKRIKGLVQVIDIMPTVLELLSIPQIPERQGKSLVPLIENSTEKINEYVFTGTVFGIDVLQSPVRKVYAVESISESLRNDEWKLIYENKVFKDGSLAQETYELYNLKNDPGESNNLINENTLVASELKKVLGWWRRESKAYVANNKSNPNVLPEEILEAARAGGYQ